MEAKREDTVEPCRRQRTGIEALGVKNRNTAALPAVVKKATDQPALPRFGAAWLGNEDMLFRHDAVAKAVAGLFPAMQINRGDGVGKRRVRLADRSRCVKDGFLQRALPLRRLIVSVTN